MRENFTYGSVRGAAGNGSPYRDSRHPIEHVTSVPLPAGREPRVALAVRVRMPSGDPLMIVNLHFDWIGDDRARFAQATQLAKYLDKLEMPLILLGDFNDRPGSRTLDLLGQDKLEAKKPASDRFTFSSTDPRSEIDFIFAAPPAVWKVRSTAVIDEPLASDHRPVLAEITIHAAGKND
ncbi:MAG: endonuclease/exonuclease/phosphatase family protein [Novipirellula sp. JB048]